MASHSKSIYFGPYLVVALQNQPACGSCADRQFVCVCVFVCVSVCVSAPRLLITSGMTWRDMNPIQLAWLDKFYSCDKPPVVVVINRCGLGIGMHHRH